MLQNINCPVLLIHGSEDFITKAESGRQIAELIGKNPTHRIIPGDDHLCSNAIGFGLALVLFAGVRERILLARVPKPLQDTAIGLVMAGMMSLAFFAFKGMA